MMTMQFVKLEVPKVFDVEGTEQSWDWLQAKYPGVRYVPDTEHTKRFQLVAVYETFNTAAIVVRVYDLAGWFWVGGNVGLYWPGPEKPISTAGALARWQPYVGAVQRTDANGHTGFGFGGGSVIKDGKGPHWCWILSPSAGSDALADFGWDGSTNHNGPLSMDFRLVQGEEPPTPPTPSDWERIWWKWGPLKLKAEVRAR